jgi:hypothetical protein
MHEKECFVDHTTLTSLACWTCSAAAGHHRHKIRTFRASRFLGLLQNPRSSEYNGMYARCSRRGKHIDLLGDSAGAYDLNTHLQPHQRHILWADSLFSEANQKLKAPLKFLSLVAGLLLDQCSKF